jgi:membrane-associated phospholipid phosphatase
VRAAVVRVRYPSWVPRPRAGAALAALLLLAPSPALAAAPLDVSPGRDGGTTLAAGGLAVLLALESDRLTPDRCRFCSPGAFDRDARTALRWRDPGAAALASDVLANGVLPAAVVGHAVFAAWGDGGARQAGEDLLAVSEAVLLSVDLNLVAKGAVGRLRPSAWAEARLEGTASNQSFYSGHTAFAFSLASAAGTVATIRGYRSAPWVWGIGMALAAGVGYLRVAGDAHWATDALAGAALGGAIGFAVPWTLHRPRRGRGTDVALLPAPGGFALRF